MGPAHSTVVNLSPKPICVITFQYTELLYFTYTAMYVIEPMGSSVVQAQPDAIGLKVALVYDYKEDTSDLLFLRFQCPNDSVLSIMEVDYDEISWYGESIEGYSKGKLKERSEVPASMVKYALHETANIAFTSSENVPPKFIKDPIRRLLEKEGVGSLSVSKSSSNLSQLSAEAASCDPGTKRETASVAASILDKWESEFSEIKALAAGAEEKLLKTRAAQAEKARYAHNIVTAALLAEAETERQKQLELEAERQRQLEYERQQKREQEKEEERLRVAKLEAEKARLLAKAGHKKGKISAENSENGTNGDESDSESVDDRSLASSSGQKSPSNKTKKKAKGKKGKSNKGSGENKECAIM